MGKYREMQMRPGDIAGAAGIGDELTARHGLAGSHEDFGKVSIERREAIVVINDDEFTVSAMRAIEVFVALRRNRASFSSQNRRADGCRKIKAIMPMMDVFAFGKSRRAIALGDIGLRIPLHRHGENSRAKRRQG